MPVPNTFASATSAIPLANLDANFATPITLGNTAVQLGNVVSTIGNVTLTNTTVSSGNVANSITLGTTAGDNASAGYVGEYVSSTVANTSGTGLTTATASNVTSISLTAGDWDVYGAVSFNLATGTTCNNAQGSISTTSATFPTNGAVNGQSLYAALTFTAGGGFSSSVPSIRLSLSTTTTVYLVCIASFAVSTAGCGGTIFARRRR